MLIVCPSCATSYQVSAASLGGSGRSVRCAKCRTVWFATPTNTIEAAASARPEPRVAAAEPPPAPPEPAPPTAADSDPWAEAFAEAAADQPAEASPDETATMASMDSPPLVPAPDPLADDALPERPRSAIPPEDIESFAARSEPPAKPRRLAIRSPRLMALIAALAVVELALVLWRADVVALWPQTASFYRAIGLTVNLRGLAFVKVGSSKTLHDGITLLAVEGSIVNTAPRTVEVPRLRYAVRDAQGHELYAWTSLPSRPVLAPGEALPFHSRLASPPPASHDVAVRFFNRNDASAASR